MNTETVTLPTMRDAYWTLGLRVGAPAREVRAAFHAAAFRDHPDVDPSPGAAARFARVRAAYDVLRERGVAHSERERALRAYVDAVVGPPPRVVDVRG